MSSDTYISFYLQTNRIHIFSQTIHSIGDPHFIRFLIKPQSMSMILESYPKKDFQSHRVPQRAKEPWKMEINSMPLCTLLVNSLNWDATKSYRVPGRIYASQNLAAFDLASAFTISK